MTQADLDAASITNVATATGTPPSGPPITSPQPRRWSSRSVQTPAISIVKSVTSAGPYNAVGNTIAYQFVATNTGNVTLSDVSIDRHPDHPGRDPGHRADL